MSFLRRLALKSVMAAKKESVAKCAGPFQYGVGRPDGANTMIKTIQYLAEADNSRVLVALDLKAAFQNVSRRATPRSIAQTDAKKSQQSSPGGTQAQRNIECTTTLPTPKSLPTVGWIRVVLYQHVVSLLLLTQPFTQSWLSSAPSTTVDQAPFPVTDYCCYHSRYQISQPCSTDHQNPNLERLLPRSHSTRIPGQGHAHTQLFGRTSANPWRY